MDTDTDESMDIDIFFDGDDLDSLGIYGMARRKRPRWKKVFVAAVPPPVIDPSDRLIELPEEILARIVSLLPDEEAMRTCVLARTWRDLWATRRWRKKAETLAEGIPPPVIDPSDRLSELPEDILLDIISLLPVKEGARTCVCVLARAWASRCFRKRRPTRRKKAKAFAAPPVIDPSDGLSKLPVEILARIISFLPADEAVRTCVLARTWRDVWMRTRRLLIQGQCTLVSEMIHGFVERLLCRRHNGWFGEEDSMAPIDACEIRFDWPVFRDSSTDNKILHIIWRWILFVLTCDVQSFRLDMWRPGSYEYTPISNHQPYVSRRHLTRLELNGLVFMGEVQLTWPEYRDTMESYYSSDDDDDDDDDPLEIGDDSGCLNLECCYVLEHLEITRCDLSNLTEVKSPSVKRLVMTGCKLCQSLHICTPLLVSLRLEDLSGNTPVLGSMPQLAAAHVSSIDQQCSSSSDDDELGITKSMVLEGLAQAKHLVLLSDENMVTFRRDLRLCPIFSNLKTLVLNADYWCESADCSALACMLLHAPILEKLTVLFSRKVEPEYDMVVEGRPDATRNSSIMISQHL